MKSRRSVLMLVVGLILALGGLAGPQAFRPGRAQATTTGCANFGGGDLFGCYISGNSNSYAFRADNAGTGGNAKGLFGYASATSAYNYGVYGLTASDNGHGVYGYASSTGSGIHYGVYGFAPSGPNGWGVVGSGSYGGLQGQGLSAGGYGTYTVATDTSSVNYGLYSSTLSSSGYAGYFNGAVQIVGALAVLGSKSFKIDHPLDPAKKYLYHAAVESPDMMNMYNGNVTLDARGQAVVELPAYFEALNQEFRYQLTAIGAPGPNLYVAEEISGNHFKIAGGKPGMKVSWQVTGIRHDPYAEQHRMQVEQDKPAQEQGTYLYPQGYGQPETMGRDYKELQRLDATRLARPDQVPAP